MLVDIELAQTFLNTAEGSHNQETIRRNHQNARKAYKVVSALLDRRSFNPAEREAVQTKLFLLKEGLDAIDLMP